MEMDRTLQNSMLTFLMEKYPSRLSTPDFLKLKAMAGSENALAAHLLYFEEHGLITEKSVMSGNAEYSFNIAHIRLTAKGIDFLAADGGLGAILNTVTVRIHDESLARIEAFLQQSDLEQPDKEGYIAQLRSLPADATKHVLLKLLDLGLDRATDALQLLQKYLG